MRKIANIMLVVMLAGCSMFASYFVAQSAVKSDRSSAALTTVTKAPVTEKNSDRVLLVEDKKADYHFYKQGKNVVLVHKGNDYIFENYFIRFFCLILIDKVFLILFKRYLSQNPEPFVIQ